MSLYYLKKIGYDIIDKIFSLFKIISFCIISIEFVYKLRKRQNFEEYKPVFLILSLEVYTLIITIINSGDVGRAIGPIISTSSLVMLTNLYFKEAPKRFIKINTMILTVLMIINLFSIVLFPQGIIRTSGGSRVYFLGIDNRFIFFYIPLIYYTMISCMKKENNKSPINLYIIIFLCIFSTIYLWSVGAFLGLFFIVITFLFGNKFKIFNYFNMKKLIWIILIFNILIVGFRVQNYFSDFIENYLKKDITLTGRTYIWDNALNFFKEKPILGYGVQRIEFFKRYYNGVAHAHNILLNYLVNTGLLGISLFMSFFFSLAKKTNKITNVQIKNLSNYVVFAIMFLSIGDTLDSGLFFMVFMTIYYYEEVFDNEKNRNNDIL